MAPDLSIDGWPDMFERAVDNLLRNAVRFNPVGQPLEVRASSAGDYLRLSVRDHGPGIAAELQEQLGEPFFRAPNQSSPGHGLGLAIARRAIERHGGHLRLGNHPDGGFIATLSLPLRRKATE
ncbi:putative two-component sensor [Pseudomonas aeruginosa]|nr:putative two-component sensor [Pseudomonas aeruginosa]